MLHSKKFDLYALALLILCFAGMFLAAALDSGCRELFPRFAADAADWTEEALGRPVTMGRWAAAAGALLGALMIARSGPRSGLAIGAALGAMGCLAAIAAGSIAGGVYWLYCLGLCFLSAASAFLRISVTGLVVSWFVRLRGRVLGLAVLGSVLYSAIGGSAVAGFAEEAMGGQLAPLAAGVAAALGLLALGTCLLLRDAPEDTGLYPDGAGYPPAEETDGERPLAKGKLLLALLCFAALAAAAAGWTGFLAPRLMARHGGGDALVTQAGPWLALGAILAIPAGYIFGWLGDWLGAMNSARLLALGEMGALALLWAFPKELGAREGVCLALSEALLMGGAPVALPCAMAQVFGRRQYFRAGQVLFPALYLAAALTGPIGTALGGGERARLYIALFALAGLGLLLSFFLRVPKKK